mmetsp:Transcript_28536/g.60222  ORF Transcript_28536/g.60222 Transcript_28536/m.60222 type:complete len:238 (+) Transcript_28536:34-747(+)
MTSNTINHYKVVLLGEGRVGKTSILLRYVENTYMDGRPSTLQASYLEKHVVLEDEQPKNYLSANPNRNSTKREAQLSIWDTAGQERFHSLGPIYYRDAKGAILVYDITDRPSFDRVKKWTKELRKMVGDDTKICISIVGNKLDLERHHRVVESEEARKYAEGVGASYLEVSAKTGSGVGKVFVELTEQMLDTVTPSHKSRLSGLASASNSMNNGINAAEETVDLSQKKSPANSSGCC